MRNVARHVRVLLPRTLAFAKRRGRLRQVLVSAPNIVQLIVRFFRLLRASRVRLVKWRTLAVLGRRYRKSARAAYARLRRSPAKAEDVDEPDEDQRRRRRDVHRALRRRLLAKANHARSFSE